MISQSCGLPASAGLLAYAMKTHAIIVAAGSGSRTGRKLPKQFAPLEGKSVYRWSVDAMRRYSAMAQVVLVVPEDWCDQIRSELEGLAVEVIAGGADRSSSVLNGLRSLKAEKDDIVLIHDAARPGLSETVIHELRQALQVSDAAAPAMPVVDALKKSTDGLLENVDRQDLFRVQTPQAFRVSAITKVLSERREGFVDDLAAVEAAGAKVTLTRGREKLHKITYDEDFAHLGALLAESRMRIGSGYDVHALVEGDGVTLCGVHVPHTFKLSGHSDADVGWHALTDAILGAIAAGDIGDHFPPDDNKWKGADSAVFLEHAVKLANDAGWRIGNCDITLICEAPKVKPHRFEMRKRTADVIGIDQGAVSIKATTTEKLGFEGRREGIAAQAVVMLSRNEPK